MVGERDARSARAWSEVWQTHWNARVGVGFRSISSFTLSATMVWKVEFVRESVAITFSCHSSSSSLPTLKMVWKLSARTVCMMVMRSSKGSRGSSGIGKVAVVDIAGRAVDGSGCELNPSALFGPDIRFTRQVRCVQQTFPACFCTGQRIERAWQLFRG